ncbi:MAG: glycosyltransferase family 9 protein [Planctomycetes bacterium]|nr:glycosyltransferase family 9 protein [Planctomycetota bacterium]
MHAPNPLPDSGQVLVVRLSALGDVLFALETVAALHAERPQVAIDFLVEDRFAAILQGHPQIRRVLTLPRRGRRRYPAAIRQLRRVRYDVLLDLSGLLKSALPVALARARLKLGMAPPAAREGSHLVVHRALRLPEPLPHRAERGLLLLRELGLRGERVAPVLPAPTAPPEFWRDLPRPRVVLHPGASAFAAFKRWPVWHHAELARRLVAAGVRVAVSQGPGEAELADRVLEAAPGALRLDGAVHGLLGIAAVYREADCVVAADTGPLHIAAAAGARVVALFGPKDPTLYGPRGVGHTVLFHDVPCRPCRRRRCVTPQCVLGLPVDRVEAAVLDTIAASRAG